MEIRLKIQSDTLFHIFCIVLFLIALNYRQMGVFLLFILFVIAIMIDFRRTKSIKVDSEFCVLLLADLTYIFFYRAYVQISTYTIILFMIGPIAAYIVGKAFVYGNEKRLENVVVIISIGMMLHAILNLTNSDILMGISERYVKDIWSNTNMTATLQGTLLAFLIGGIYWFLSKRNFFYKAIGIIGIIFTLWNSFLTGSRTPLFLIVIEIIFIAMYKAYITNARMRLKKIVKAVLGLLLLVSIVIIMYNLNIFGLKSLYQQSSLFLRFQMMDTIVEDTRINHFFGVLQKLVKYPMGNINDYTGNVSYAHNFWLDIGRQTGFIPMILFIIFSIQSVKKYIFVIKQKFISIDTRVLITGIYFSIGAFFFLEPIMEGNPWLFFMVCTLCGGISSIKSRGVSTN